MTIRLLFPLLFIILIIGISGANETANLDNLSFLMSEENVSHILISFEEGKFQEFNENDLIPHREELYKKLAIALAAKGEYNKALDILLLIPPEERSRDTSTLLAFMCCRIEDYDRATGYITDLRTRYPDDRDLDNAMAYILSISGNPDAAIEIQKGIIRQLPDYAPVLDTWGTIQLTQGNYEEAAVYVEKARQSLPDDAEVLTHLAEIYVRLGRLADAQDLYQQAIKIDPAYGPGQKGYAKVLMGLKRYQEAVDTIKIALKLMPGDPDLITWEKEIDAILLSWHIRQEQEAGHPLLIKRVVQVNHS